MSTATTAGGFRVDAPQPEKSRREGAPDLLERLLVDMANAASDLHGMCSHEGFTDAVTVLRGGTPLLVGEVRRLGEAAVRWETRAHTAGAELAALRGQLREWATTRSLPFSPLPIEVWPGLAELLDGPTSSGGTP